MHPVGIAHQPRFDKYPGLTIGEKGSAASPRLAADPSALCFPASGPIPNLQGPSDPTR